MIAAEQQTRLSTIRRYLTTAAAKDEVGRALYATINAGIAFGPRELPTPEEREWLRGAVALPLQESVDVALEVLAWRVSQILDNAPKELRARYDRSHEWADLGWE